MATTIPAMRLRLLLAGLSIAMLCASGVAGAAQRYAAPAGSGTACTQGAPCSLQQAITAAGANDEVIVGAGSYTVGATIAAPPAATNLYIHGDLGGPMPHIEATTPATPISFSGTGGHLSYLDIANTGTSAWGSACPYGGRLDRLRLRISGGGSIGIYVFSNCTVTDSVLVVGGESAIGLLATSITGPIAVVARNLTVLATGKESVGISASYNGIVSGSVSIDLKNSIASGVKADLFASGSLGTGSIAVTNSNFDLATASPPSKIEGVSNQTAPPLFVNSAAGDYREAAGSPTIDAGSSDGIAAADLDGNPRSLGAAPDIGAYEYVPPASPPSPVGSLQSLELKPKAFRTRKAGGAIFSKQGASVGTQVRYALSAAATVNFSVERALPGRKVGKKCSKPNAANRERKKCTRFKAKRPPFSHTGAAGQNSFKFSGRVGGKALRPGRYRLVARANGTVKRAGFRVVR